jgi:hypothetical protein
MKKLFKATISQIRYVILDGVCIAITHVNILYNRIRTKYHNYCTDRISEHIATSIKSCGSTQKAIESKIHHARRCANTNDDVQLALYNALREKDWSKVEAAIIVLAHRSDHEQIVDEFLIAEEDGYLTEFEYGVPGDPRHDFLAMQFLRSAAICGLLDATSIADMAFLPGDQASFLQKQLRSAAYNGEISAIDLITLAYPA